MGSEKKCPECGKWSSWNEHIDDTCDHCGALLSPEDKNRKEKKEKQKLLDKEKWMFNIRESDPAWKKAFKKVGNVFYYILMAILSFIAWLVAALPG